MQAKLVSYAQLRKSPWALTRDTKVFSLAAVLSFDDVHGQCLGCGYNPTHGCEALPFLIHNNPEYSNGS